MRILVFANLPPYVMGGAENQVARLAEAWTGAGHSVTVAGHHIPTAVVTLGNHQVQTCRLRTFDGAGRFGRAATYLISAFLILARFRKEFDIIYCRGMGDAAISVTLAKTAGLIRIPVIVCPINAKGKGDASFIRSIPGWRMIVRLLNRHCNAVNIIAPAISDDLRELGIDIPVTTSIPNGIPVEPLRHQTSRGKYLRMIFTGRLSPQKGLDLLITALSRLYSRGHQFQLDIVGDGPLKGELNALICKLDLKKHIHLLGQVPPGEIRNLLVQHDAFVLPSRYEGMSNSALEAMEAGIPVLVSRCGGIDRYIDAENGWICEPENLDSLTDSLCLLLETPHEALIKMGNRARCMVENRFEIGTIAFKNIELMEHVLLSSKSG